MNLARHRLELRDQRAIANDTESMGDNFILPITTLLD
jgi:hypothetical protein